MRKKLQEHIDKFGVTKKHIAKQLDVSNAMITYYLKNERNLKEENELKLKKYLKQFEQMLCI